MEDNNEMVARYWEAVARKVEVRRSPLEVLVDPAIVARLAEERYVADTARQRHLIAAVEETMYEVLDDPHQRLVIHMALKEQYGYRQIARILKISRARVVKIVDEAVQRLAEHFAGKRI